MEQKNTKNNYVSAMYQAVAFFITISVLVVLFTIRFNMFIVHDPPIAITQNNESGKNVTAGLHITNFTDFQVPQNKFVFEGTVWFAFDPQIVSLDIIKKFGVAHGQLLHVSDPITMQHDNEIIAQFDVRIKFNTPLNYRLFPLDDHRIEIVLLNRFLPDNVHLNSSKSNITFSSSLHVPGWHIIGHDVKTGFTQIELIHNSTQYGTQPQLAIISLSCERADPGIIVSILLTFLLLLFIALFTFSSGEDNVLIVSVSIVALVGYQVVIHSVAPAQVSYFIFSDYIYLISLLTIVAVLLAGAFIREKTRSLAMKKGLIAAIYSFFVGGCFLASILL